MLTRVCCVLGSYNRFEMLKSAIASVRANAGGPIDFIVIDGGSNDGSREWLAVQPDVQLLGERGLLKGPIKAFNLAFWWAIQHDYEYIFHFNDDAILETPGAVTQAIEVMDLDPKVGAVAFRFDLFKEGFDSVHLKTYSNFGVLRTKAAREAARMFGEPDHHFWSEMYLIYGGDSELGARTWKLGYTVHRAENIRVRDLNAQDQLRRDNALKNPDRKDSRLFWARWEKPESLHPIGSSIQWSGAKLHFGCGQKRLHGWVNFDGQPSPATDVVGDALTFLRAIPDGVLGEVYSSHVIEHFPPDKLADVLCLLKLAMQRGAWCRIATINLPGIFKFRYEHKGNLTSANAAIYGETRSTDHTFAAHRQAFDYPALEIFMKAAGFQNIAPWNIDQHGELARLGDFAYTDRDATVYIQGQR